MGSLTNSPPNNNTKMGCTYVKANPEWENYNKTKMNEREAIARAEKGEFENLAYCAGLWNNYIAPCDISKLKNLVNWAAHCDVYIHKDGKTLLIKGYSEIDMF